MKIGIPRELKAGERRVGLDPAAVAALVADGHRVWIESGAGLAIGRSDLDYRALGADIGGSEDVWSAELIVKVKEIQPGEDARLKPGQTVFGYQQLVGAPHMTCALAARGASAIAFELVRDPQGAYPLLSPMSVVAGKMAILVGAQLLLSPEGNGALLAASEGVEGARVLVLGAGSAGLAALRVALSLGARASLLTRSQASCDAARVALGAHVEAAVATREALEAYALGADLVVGAVRLASAPTPKLLSRALVSRMQRGAVIVDVSIDGGGVAETSRPTTHANPTYVEHGVVHYCVPNMPAAAPRASTQALSAAVLPFARELAAKGVARALRDNAGLRAALLLWNGRVADPLLASEAGLAYTPIRDGDLA
ncbi:MAG TPA: alanine dehydrogenase [Usitatibacter sp.]|nr:alanine dehydrogenase [Usitatibacter sp.]